jgi:ubiquinone/menaquinone biosynthesis C-methylase UbiE
MGAQPLPEQELIYQSEAEGYERLIRHEDHQGNLLRALQEIVSVKGRTVIDLGAGTGRFTRALAASASHVLAVDISPHMLRLARTELLKGEQTGWGIIVGDNRHLPVRSGAADIVIAGWSFGHATVWHAGQWRDEIITCIAEMMRVLRKGGTAIICETLGTGSLEPHPPTSTLDDYYRYIETEQWFERIQISTDYKFDTVDEAVETIRFFFGEDLAGRVAMNQWSIVPEWTGIWWRTT